MPQAPVAFFLPAWEALPIPLDCKSQVDTPQELSLGLLLPKSEPGKGAHLPLWPSKERWLSSLGTGCQLPAACLPLLAIPAEAGQENAIWGLLRKAAVWSIHFQKVRCNYG